ncbi:MAG: ATP-binding cassette domain-containing protein [Tepidisphaera sp.]|nr:ATP-binding cassette domain-containing protein [Tepidisphaera sp.]
MNEPAFLVAQNISKRFGITQALDDVSVSFRRGEVHALMGENGAGKSTLGKTIAGLYRQDQGTVTLDGRVLTPGDIDGSFAAGVRLVHQELAQCPNLSVAENLSLHQMPASKAGFVDFRAMRERAARLVHALEPGIDVTAPLGGLSPGRRQICQIAAALDEDASDGGSKAKVIVLDEPTSSLSVAEADRLLEITRHLAGLGITIIYVSHRMGEIFQVCDRVTVLRDGKFVATNVVKDIDEPTLVEQMIGRRLQTPARASNAGSGAATGAGNERAILEVRGLSSPGRLDDVSLEVRGGEVVGVGGLVGAGRSELLDAIFGLDAKAQGIIRCEQAYLAGAGGRASGHAGARAAIAAGVGYVPEDRRRQGLFFELGIDENIVMPFMVQLASALGLRAMPRERGLVREKMTDFRVKAASPASKPGELSGGNQQKLLIARWMGKNTRLLLLDEPTRGIDIGTKSEVYRLVREAADRGMAVLLVSSEMPELLALSDRVLVMASGKLQGELRGEQATQTNILRLATGTG